MKKTAYALAGALACSLMAASNPAAAQTLAPAVYPLGPSFAYFPAYYIYVPANRYSSDTDIAPSAATRYVLFDDVYPPAIYGPHLRPVARR